MEFVFTYLRLVMSLRGCEAPVAIRNTLCSFSLLSPTACFSSSFSFLPPAGYFCHQRQKYPKRRLKLRFKTSSARYALCQTCLMLLAESVFPCTAVGQKDCATTAFRYRFAAAACCHGSSFPLYRRTVALPLT